jgi:hypothetical protein
LTKEIRGHNTVYLNTIHVLLYERLSSFVGLNIEKNQK